MAKIVMARIESGTVESLLDRLHPWCVCVGGGGGGGGGSLSMEAMCVPGKHLGLYSLFTSLLAIFSPWETSSRNLITV